MENKISLAELAAMLALSTGKQKDLCERFLSELFSIVEEELINGENVRIKGFGTFKLVEVEPRKSVNVATGEDNEIPGHNKVIFVMAKELASLVNAPFDAFEAVEIADGLATDVLEGEREVDEIVEWANEPSEENESYEENESPEDSALSEKEPVLSEKDPERDNDQSEYSEDNAALVVSEEDPPELDSFDLNTNNSIWKRYKFIFGFLAGVCAAVLIGWMVFIYYGGIHKPDNGHDKVAAAELLPEESQLTENNAGNLVDSVATDSISDGDKISNGEEVATQPSDSPVYDTVSTTRYLTTIAKEHYGNFNLWPIIYEENSAILGHPDRIRPGTKVVVPPLSKYNVDPNKPADIEAMKRKGKAIYSKFK